MLSTKSSFTKPQSFLKLNRGAKCVIANKNFIISWNLTEKKSYGDYLELRVTPSKGASSFSLSGTRVILAPSLTAIHL